jgi:beta-glucosidase
MGPVTRINGVAGGTYAIPRLGIPEIDVADGPVGLRLGGVTGGATRTTTAFPIPSSMAATWDLAGMEQVGKSLGYEMKEYGVDVLLGPALNIQRDPRGGRNFEYYTEDPFLNGKLTAAFVRGVQSNGVGATLKHFAANNTETNRNNLNEIIGERALREIYLPGFEMAVKEARPWAVMSAYPAINGTIAAQNQRLLTDILRGEWGFDGLVMSDWFAVKDPVAGAAAGNDLIMPAANAGALAKAVKDGQLDEKILDRNVRNLLRLIIKTPSFQGYQPSNNPDKKAYIPFVRQMAAEGMVLLKNDTKALPVSTKKKIALFGRNAFDFIVGGGGSAEVNPDYKVQLTEGLTRAGYSLVSATKAGKPLVEGSSPTDIAAAAAQSDIAVLSIGRYSSEGADKYSMDMNADEVQLIQDVSAAFHKAGKKLVVLLNIGAPLEIASWAKLADAILLTWQPGQEAGNAVADVLSGAVNPSGKLAETFPVAYRDAPSSINFPTGSTVLYGEGIFNGYRWYDSKGAAVQYPFGYGLSYTSCTYSRLKLGKASLDLDKDASLELSVDVTNSGALAGKEIVQLYVSDPASLIQRPLQELKAFDKIGLKPGETKTVSFKLDRRSFAAWDESANAWVAAPGSYTIRVGASSRDIRQEASLTATGSGPGSIGPKTAWTAIQASGKQAAVVAKYIGDVNMNLWYAAWVIPEGNLQNVLKHAFEQNPELKGNEARQAALMDQIIKELNAL